MSKVEAKNETPSSIPATNTTPYVEPAPSLGMDDGNTSQSLLNQQFTAEDAKMLADGFDDAFSGVYHSVGIYKRHEIDYFNQRYRFGILNPYGALTNCREYLFFTKPDLNIYPRNNTNGVVTGDLAPFLQTQPYWLDLVSKHFPVVKCLQQSIDTGDKFNHLLENCVSSNLEVPGLSTDMIETPSNMYGVNLQYHGSSEASNDSFDFSLEFTDTKNLDVYHFFRAYEDYQTAKHHGQVTPYLDYVVNKILYDKYSIYKFLVDEDGETIVYYAKFYGVTSKSLPRDTFSNTQFDGGITYSIEFNAAFFEDMNPFIIKEFNNLSENFYNALPYQIDIHNHILDRVDNRSARAAYIVEEDSKNYGHKVYKIKWKGDKKE